jgi:hypothetical protein
MMLKINGVGIPCIEQFLYDGCHKIYLIDSGKGRHRLYMNGWSEDDFQPINELPETWAETCELRFVASSTDPDKLYVEQGVNATVEVV